MLPKKEITHKLSLRRYFPFRTSSLNRILSSFAKQFGVYTVWHEVPCSPTFTLFLRPKGTHNETNLWILSTLLLGKSISDVFFQTIHTREKPRDLHESFASSPNFQSFASLSIKRFERDLYLPNFIRMHFNQCKNYQTSGWIFESQNTIGLQRDV